MTTAAPAEPYRCTCSPFDPLYWEDEIMQGQECYHRQRMHEEPEYRAHFTTGPAYTGKA